MKKQTRRPDHRKDRRRLRQQAEARRAGRLPA